MSDISLVFNFVIDYNRLEYCSIFVARLELSSLKKEKKHLFVVCNLYQGIRLFFGV